MGCRVIDGDLEYCVGCDTAITIYESIAWYVIIITVVGYGGPRILVGCDTDLILLAWDVALPQTP